MTRRPPLWAACFSGLLVLGANSLVAEESPTASTDAAARPVAEIRRELIAWRKVLDTSEDERAPERLAAKAGIQAIGDARAVPILVELWQKDNEAKSTKHHGLYLAALKNIADVKAFNAIVKISVESRGEEIRRDAASWIALQDNRDQAIPLFTKYLKSKRFFSAAISSLGYTDITRKAQRPLNREFVAALIDNLILVTPDSESVPVYRDTGWKSFPDGHMRRRGDRDVVTIIRYSATENAEAKRLLYEYTNLDYGYDQSAWRQNVVNALPRTVNRQ